MDDNTKDILESLVFIKERMATKDDLNALRTEFEEFREETRENFASLRAELRDIRQRLDALEELARNSAGLTKEIDHLMERLCAIEKHLGTPGLADHVAALMTSLREVDPFDEPHVETAVRGTAAERGIRAGVLIHATRVAVTGRTTSPGLFELLVLLARERTIERIERLVNFLATRAIGGVS